MLRHRWVPVLVGGRRRWARPSRWSRSGLIKFEFIPASDNGQVTVTVEMPPGSSLEATENVLKIINTRLARHSRDRVLPGRVGSGRRRRVAAAGSGVRFGRVQVVLHELHHRQRSNSQIADEIIAATKDIPVATVRVATASGGGGGAQPVQALITGEDPHVLQALAAAGPGHHTAHPRAPATSPTASRRPTPRRGSSPTAQRMADAGITAQQVSQVLRTADRRHRGHQAARRGPGRGRRAAAGDRRSARADLTSIHGDPDDGDAWRPDRDHHRRPGDARVLEVAGPTSVDRRNRQRLVTIGADLAGGVR